jgi:hypothetical protein
VFRRQSPPFAGIQTLSTVNADIRVEQKDRVQTLRLGIATPLAGERTSLQKGYGSYTRPVMDGVSLYIENDSAAAVIYRFHLNTAPPKTNSYQFEIKGLKLE